MFTVSVESIALMPCIRILVEVQSTSVREIDALGGEMGKKYRQNIYSV